MALVFEGITCMLCGKVIDLDKPHFASWATPDETGKCVLEYSDAPLHWDCLFQMEGVDKFLDLVYRARTAFFDENEYWKVLARDESMLVATNGMVVRVEIPKTGLTWDIPHEDWPDGLLIKRSSPDLACLPANRREIALEVIETIEQELKH